MPQPNITLRTGNIFTTKLPAFGHGVNTYGYMGAGIAKQVREKYPEVYDVYRIACKKKTLLPGGMLPVEAKDKVWVLNLASQHKPGADARLNWVEDSVTATFKFCVEHNLTGFALPRIGAGIGGLKWEDVVQVIDKIAATYPQITVELWTFEPEPKPDAHADASHAPGHAPARDSSTPDSPGLPPQTQA